MLKNLTGMANLLKNAGQISDSFAAVKDKLRQQRVTGQSGAEMVIVEMNGLAEVLRVKLDPTLVQQQETEMLETLLQGAINDATTKAREKHAEIVRELIGGLDLPLPGLAKTLEGLSDL